MLSNVELFYRDRWLQQTFIPYKGEHIEQLYRYEFRFQANTQVLLKTFHVNEELFHTFEIDERQFDFALMVAKPYITLTIDYELEEQLLQESFMLEVDGALLPTQDYLDELQSRYLKWQRKVRDYVEVYDEDEIELSEFYSDQDWQVTFKQLKDRLMIEDPDAIWFYIFRKEITMHLQQILRKPKVKLVSEEILVNAAELDIITPRTIQHFMKDTTTWAKSTMSRPVPQQLLKEMNEESTDIYENRFVYTFAFHLEREMRRLIKELKDHLHTIESKLASNNMKIELDILQVEAEFENLELYDYQSMFELALSQLKGLYNLVRQTIKAFRGLKRIQGYVMPNQVLLYNKDYGTLYRFYNKYMRATMEKELKFNDSIDYQTYYRDEVFFTMLQHLQHEGFEHEGPILVKVGEQLGTYIFEKEERAFQFTHSVHPIEVIVKRNAQFEIELTFSHTETLAREYVKFLPSIVQFQKYVSTEMIEQLYGYPVQVTPIVEKRLKRKDVVVEKEQPVVMVVYPAKTKEDFLKSIRYEQLHLVMTMGTNFIDSAKFQAYGAMKYGVFPYTISDMSKQLFKRFIRLQLFKLGVRTYCFMCGEAGEQTKRGDYICSNPLCRCEWGVRLCQCGAPLYKMQKKSKQDSFYLTEEQQQEQITKSDLDWLFEKENINATMGLGNLCENAHLGTNFFTVCPNCGDCRQQSRLERICKRCNAVERNQCKD